MRGEWRPIRASALLGGLLAAVLAACGPGGGAAPAASAARHRRHLAPPHRRRWRRSADAADRGPDRRAQRPRPPGDPRRGRAREGALLWYTALIVNQAVRPLVDGFNQKYPYVKVDHYRADSTDMIQRIPTSTRPPLRGRHHRRHEHAADDQSRGLAGEVRLAVRGGLPERARDPEGYWDTSNLYFMTPGINTRLVSKDEAPKTYEDLLNPRWKGQMGWSTSAGAGAPMFVGNVLQTMGQDAAWPTWSSSASRASAT